MSGRSWTTLSLGLAALFGALFFVQVHAGVREWVRLAPPALLALVFGVEYVGVPVVSSLWRLLRAPDDPGPDDRDRR